MDLPRDSDLAISNVNPDLPVVSFSTAEIAGLAPEQSTFHWREIESDDYAVYIANLRRLGCPERIIRDIILLDIELVYAARERNLSVEVPYWHTGREREKLKLRREVELHRLMLEKQSVIRELLGIEWTWSTQWGIYETLLPDLFFDFLPSDHRKTVMGFSERFHRFSEIIGHERSGILLAEDHGAIRDIYNSLTLELQNEIGTAGVVETLARLGGVFLFSEESPLKDLFLIEPAVTGTEWKEIALRNSGLLESLVPLFPDKEIKWENSGALDAVIRELESSLEPLLGRERFAAYQRAKDPIFKEVDQWMDKHLLPRSASEAVYDLRRAAEAFADVVKTGSEITPENQTRTLGEMEREMEQALRTALGYPAGESYFQHIQRWREQVFSAPP
jgi:hypothetical protein